MLNVYLKLNYNIILALKKIEIEGAVHLFYSLVRKNKNLYDDFLSDAKKKFHIEEEKKFSFKEDLDEVEELETLIEDMSLNNAVLPKCLKTLRSIPKQINYQAHEIRTRSSMFRVYYIKERSKGKIIILGHIKSNKKDQDRELKRVVKIAKTYYNYQLISIEKPN